MVSSPVMIGESADAAASAPDAPPVAPVPATAPQAPVRLDPTRYGDWERNGRCIDF
jgi:hypothetical protein